MDYQPQGLRRALRPHGPALVLRGAEPPAAGVGTPSWPICRANCWSAAIRFSVEGWVENRLSMPRPVSGLTINRCAVAGVISAVGFSICWAALEIFASAEARAPGRPDIRAPRLSA